MKIKARVTKINDESKPNLKGFASITVENCCTLNGIRVVEGKDGLFASFPQKPAMKDGEPQNFPDGKPMYNDIFYTFVPKKDENGDVVNDTDAAKEVRDKIFNLVLEAYQNENGRAYINQEKGEFVNAKIEPNLHACNGEVHKAAGSLLIGGYIKVPDVFVDLAHDKQEDPFLAVNYPRYKSGEKHKSFVEPLTKGKVWDSKEKVEKDYNFKAVIEGVMKKQTLEFHPELAAELAKNKSVDDEISKAKAVAEGGASGKDKVQEAPELAQ